MGRVYSPREKDLPEERETLAAIISGSRTGISWLGQRGYLDFFDAKGVVEALLQRIGVAADFRPARDRSLHPGRTAEVVVGNDVVGIIGELHPRVVETFELLAQPVALFELDIQKLISGESQGSSYHSVSRFPQSARDIAIVIDSQIPSKSASDIILCFPLVNRVDLFDVYTGDQIPPGKKSLAFRVVYRSPTHTLTDSEVEGTLGEIIAKLSQELGATVRSR
ncbi:MAG: hypothetical protein NTU41_09700 [Chloroflexi bacterium]|nr:hypothetical protein [Chloroflexota bacterium]